MTSKYIESVAATIINQLKKGTAPWIKPWQPGERFMPFNPASGNSYHGMNAIWLLSVMENHGYADNRWLTFKQANSLDAQVNRGEKGTAIQYWKWTEDVSALDESGNPLTDEAGKALKQLVRLQKPKVWSAIVFNADQITGLPELERMILPRLERHQEAEAILNDSKASIIHRQGDGAFYSPSTDTITLPEREQFLSSDRFYATALHELGHWTGHNSRLNRDLAHPFGSREYAKEELRAEIASLMLGENLGIGHNPGHHVAYVASWIKILQDDPREIFRATADAERITKYLQGREMLQTQVAEQKITENVLIPVMTTELDTTLRTGSDRTYLDVPFAQKDQAKALGAKWDRTEKSWYVLADVSLEPFQQWMEPKQALYIEPIQSPEAEFAGVIKSAGLVLDGMPIMDGRMHRVPVEGDDNSQKSGSYVGFLDGHPAGYINNYKTGYERKWKSKQPQKSIDTKERAILEAAALERKDSRIKEQGALQQKTADAVAAIWSESEIASDSHPYLKGKGVPALGLRINTVGPLELTGNQPGEKPQQWSSKGELLIPIQDIDGHFLGGQSVDNNGRKSFPRGGRLNGGHYVIGAIEAEKKVLIAEGYATAATLHEATALPVIVAFHSGNLLTVAQAYREKFPDKLLIIAGDNDHTQPAEKNVGRQKAEEAAKRTGGHVMLPEFETGSPGSDWNDVANLKGLDAVKFALTVGLKEVDRKIMVAEQALHANIQKQKQDKQVAKHSSPEKDFVQASGGMTLGP